MEMQDKDRYERIRETLGDWCGMVELVRVEESDAMRWLVAEAEKRGSAFEVDAARELADALGSDLMLIIAYGATYTAVLLFTASLIFHRRDFR